MSFLETFYNKITGKKKKEREEKEKLAKEEVARVLDDVVKKSATPYVTASSGNSENSNNKNTEMVKTYSNLAMIYSEVPGAIQCGNLIRTRILSGGFQIEATNSKDEINEKDPEYVKLSEFLAEPNKEDTLEDIWSALIQNYIVYGNAFVEKTFSGDSLEKGKLEEVYILNTEKTKILLDKEEHENGSDVVVGYKRVVGTKKAIDYEIDEVSHFRRPSPVGDVYGQSILENHTAVLSLVLQALRYNVTFLKNDGKGPMQIILPEGTTEVQARSLRQYFSKEYEGEKGAGKTLFLFGGAEAKELGASVKDMDYLNLMQFCKKEVAGMFSVPLVLISDPEGSNRASSIEERKGFDVNYIIPERMKLLRKFNREIIVDGLGVTKYRLTIKEADAEEKSKLTEEASKALVSGLATPNEEAQHAGWETVDEDWANKKYLISGATAVEFGKIDQQKDNEKQKKEIKSLAELRDKINKKLEV